MHIRDLQGKRICLLGFGKENQATLRAIERFAPDAVVTIADANPSLAKPITSNQKRITYRLGETYLHNLEQFDIIIKTPGIPPCQELDAVKKNVTNATQIFLDTVCEVGSIVVGVTGTKGKSTTASLIAAILKHAGKDAHLVGNIGIPTLDFLDYARKGTIFIQEMSSYQLMDITVSPPVAVITSLFPDHLDYHGSYESYKEAKKNITRFQKTGDMVFFAALPEATKEIADVSHGSKVAFTEKDSPIAIEDTHLIGRHNQRNIGGAWKVAEFLGIDRATAIEAIREFHGLPHRLQSVGIHHGIEWIDDAISTTPESTIAALDALGDRVATIILGGQDRGLDFTILGEHIARSSIQTVILFPGSGPRIEAVLRKADAKTLNFSIETMEEAVEIAKRETKNSFPAKPEPSWFRGSREKLKTQQEPICLLSPASPSYNQFRNFEEKGERFKECILRLQP